MREDSKVRRSLFQTSYTVFSTFCATSVCIESYLYVMGCLHVILENQIEGLSLEFESG